jgi:hypothetical protein
VSRYVGPLPAKTQYEEDYAAMVLHRAWEALHGPGESCPRCPQPITTMCEGGPLSRLDFRVAALEEKTSEG